MNKSFALQLLIILISFLIVLSLIFRSSLLSSISEGNNGISPTPTIALSTEVFGSFSVDLPEGWRYEPQTGVDSFVGALKGEGITLLFDYGHYSNTLAREGDPRFDITYETIGGQKAKLVRSKATQGITGVYFADTEEIAGNTATPSGTPILKNMLQINGENIPSEKMDTVLNIFRSIRFIKN